MRVEGQLAASRRWLRRSKVSVSKDGQPRMCHDSMIPKNFQSTEGLMINGDYTIVYYLCFKSPVNIWAERRSKLAIASVRKNSSMDPVEG